MARAIVRALLRHILGAAGLLLCLGVQANTLGIVTSGQGAAYDEFVEAVRQELKSVPGLKIQLVGLDAEGAQPYDRIDFRPPTALVVGAEGEGLRRLVREHCDFIAALPMIVATPAGVGAGLLIAAPVMLRQVLARRGAVAPA